MQAAALRDIVNMQERAFEAKEDFQDMLYLEFNNEFRYFFRVFSIQTESHALNEFRMTLREFRAFRRRVLPIFESMRRTFHVYIRHIAKQRKMRQFLSKVDRCANRLLRLRRTTVRKCRLCDLQSLRNVASRA